MTSRMKNLLPWALILVIVLLYFAGNVAWRKQQPALYPLNRSEALHFLAAMEWWDQAGHRVLRLPKAFIDNDCINAPIPPLITALLMTFGKQQSAALYTLYVNLLYLLVALVCTYKITEHLAGMAAGILAVTLLALYPATYGLSRIYGHCDFPVAAALSLNILCLLKSDRFRNPRWSLLYGLSTGLGLLTKDIFIAFFGWPLAVAIGAVALQKTPRARQLLHMGAAVFLGLAIAAPHYLKEIVYRKVFFELVTESGGRWHDWHNLRVFTAGMFQHLLSPPLFIAFLTGAALIFRSTRNRYGTLVLASWIVVPWLVMMFMPHKKMAFYAVPLLPAIAAVSAAGLLAIRMPFKRTLFAGLLAVSIMQYFDFSYASCGPGLENRVLFSVNGEPVRYYSLDNEIVFARDGRAMRYEKLMRAIKNAPRGEAGDAPLIIIDQDCVGFMDPVVAGNIGWLNNMTLDAPADSVFWDLDTGKRRRSCVFYLGNRVFASDDFFRDHMNTVLNMAKTHPATRDGIMASLTPARIREVKNYIRTANDSFTRRTVLFSDGDLTGTLFHD